jgi:hypothetical protein
MSRTEQFPSSFAGSDYARSPGQKGPDFRARAAARQAWLERRSAPRKGLWPGLIAGTAIGCLGAFAAISVLPSQMPRRESVDNVAAAPAAPHIEKPRTEPREDKQVSSGRSSDFALQGTSADPLSPAQTQAAITGGAAPSDAVAGSPATDPVTTPLPRPRPSGRDTGPRVATDVIQRPVTSMEPPATRSLSFEPPVVAEGGGKKTKSRAVTKKKNIIVEDRNPPPRLHNWPGERRKPVRQDWASGGGDSFFFGW